MYIIYMRSFPLFLLFLAVSVFAAPLNLTGVVKDENGAFIKDAVVLLKVNKDLIAYARTLSGTDGSFILLPGKDAPSTTPIARPAEIRSVNFASYQAMDLKGRAHSVSSLSQGIYVILGKTESGKVVNLGKVYHRGGALKITQAAVVETNNYPSILAKSTIGGTEVQFIVRKTGYLPKEVSISSFDQNVGDVVLVRDSLEARIDSVMGMMNLTEKIAQMTQPELGNDVTSAASGTSFLYGSVLNGGDGYTASFLTSMVNTLNSWPAGRARIPTSYGKDAVHGNAGIPGYTVFPHNIGLGATRDSALVRLIGEATAKELWAARIDLNFSPAISVAQDPRWGRTYESYGETAELTAQMGAAMVRGLQGERYNADWRVTATAKHYLADGGTTNGRDRGNTTATDEVLRTVHLPGYEAVVEQGVLSVMASFNTINNVHQHIDSARLTGWLKTELGFDGYIISDWSGIAHSTSPGFTDIGGYGWNPCKLTALPPLNSTQPSLTQEAVRKAINAGIDLAMEPGTYSSFRTHLNNLVTAGNVSMDRINDAVRRILRAKFRAGRMDNFSGPSEYAGNTAKYRASDEHRALAREAVAKSQVLLKNTNSALPLSPTASIHVFGSHSNDIGLQCGGWTHTWQGTDNFTGVGTSILQGMQLVAPQATFGSATNSGVIVYVIGENPTYAEWCGDVTSLDFSAPSADMTNLASYRASGKKIVTIFVTGRPRIVPQLIDASDAFIVAWLPGSEGAGVADVLFGDYKPTGKLPMTWPGTTSYPYGFGLSYQ